MMKIYNEHPDDSCVSRVQHCEFVPDDYYERRVSHFAYLSVKSGDVIMLGDSLINGCEWHELLNNPSVKNRGVNGDTVEGVRQRLSSVLQGTPARVLVMVGINDVSHDIDAHTIAQGIIELAGTIVKQSPATVVYVHSLLPFDASLHYALLEGKEEVVRDVNNILCEASDSANYCYIDLYPHFLSNDGVHIDAQYTNDGLHLNGNGYVKWAQLIQSYINE